MPLSDAESARALDAWLQEHLGSADRRAAVRGVADRLEDLQGCEYDELDEALELSTWPNLTRKRFLGAWRRLKGDAAPASVTPDASRAAPPRVAAPPPLPLSPASSASATADESGPDDDAWEAGARALLREARDAVRGLEGLRPTLTRYGFGGPPPPWRSGYCDITVPAMFPAVRSLGAGRTKIRSLPDLVHYLQRALGAKAPARATTAVPSASDYATTGDAELARRLAMGLPPRRASSGPSPPPTAAPRPSPEASDAEADESSDDDDVPLSQWQAQAAAAPWAVGDKVEAKFCVKGGQRSKYSRDYYPATVAAVHGDGTVDVDYDTSDEETEERLPVRHVRKRRRAAPSAASEPPAPKKKKTKKAPAKTAHAPGDERSRLMAQCLKRGILCQGSATTMEYMQQKLAAYAGPEPTDDLRVGGACYCRWGDRWYGAKVLSVDGGSYRVHFLGWGKRYDSDCAAEDVRPAR